MQTETGRQGEDLIEPPDRDGPPAPLAAVDGVEPPAPQDARRREAARGRRQLGPGRGVHLARQRQWLRACLLRAGVLPRAEQLPLEDKRPRLCLPRPRLRLPRPRLRLLRPPQKGGPELFRLAQQLSLARLGLAKLGTVSLSSLALSSSSSTRAGRRAFHAPCLPQIFER